jgi:hypothetical protein
LEGFARYCHGARRRDGGAVPGTLEFRSPGLAARATHGVQPDGSANHPFNDRRPAFRDRRQGDSNVTTAEDRSIWRGRTRRERADEGEPTKVHHLERDPELLIELPDRIEIYRILVDDRAR